MTEAGIRGAALASQNEESNDERLKQADNFTNRHKPQFLQTGDQRIGAGPPPKLVLKSDDRGELTPVNKQSKQLMFEIPIQSDTTSKAANQLLQQEGGTMNTRMNRMKDEIQDRVKEQVKDLRNAFEIKDK